MFNFYLFNIFNDCNDCNFVLKLKTFWEKWELIEHCAKYHEGEKMPLVRSKKIPFRCAVCEVSFVSKDLLLEHKAVAHGLTQRRKRDGKLKMKTGKKPKKLETVDKKEVNENEKAENKDADLDIQYSIYL